MYGDDLAAAIDSLAEPPDGAGLARLLRLQGLLDAKASSFVGGFDASGRWEGEGATSMQAWLRQRAGLSPVEANARRRRAARLRAFPHTQQAWRDGELTSGQVDAILSNVKRRTAGLYAEHEDRTVALLAGMGIEDTVAVMREWAARAEALCDPGEEPAEPRRRLFHSRTLDGRYELRGSFDAEAGAVIAEALRLADARTRAPKDSDKDGGAGTGTADGGGAAADGTDGAGAAAGGRGGRGGGDGADGEGAGRGPAERRADALYEICLRALDFPDEPARGRERPHLNVVVDYDDLLRKGQGRLLDDTPLDGEALRRVACDAGLHRVFVAGRSTVLDYGRATRTIPADLWAALVIRDGGCRAPGCDRGPSWCEGHHVCHWADGGETSMANLVVLCARHHHLFHRPGWHLELAPDGTLDVTAPNGSTRHTKPPRLRDKAPCA